MIIHKHKNNIFDSSIRVRVAVRFGSVQFGLARFLREIASARACCR